MSNKQQQLFFDSSYVREEIAAIQQQLRECQSARNVFDMDKFGDKAILDLKERFFNLMGLSPLPQSKAKIPEVKTQLYERVLDGEVLDLGTVDTSVEDLNTRVDVEMTNVSHLSPNVGVVDPEDFTTEKVVTSYLVLNHVGDMSAVKKHDGLHVVWNVDDLVNSGAAGQLDGDTFSTVIKIREKEKETKKLLISYKRVGVPGTRVCLGFNMINTYKKRTVDVWTTELLIRGRVEDMGRKRGFVDCDVYTPNYLGDYCELHLSGNRGTYIEGDKHYGAACVGFDGDLKLGVMLMYDYMRGCYRHYRLVRVLKFRNYVPYHGANNLEYFAHRLDIRINGGKILGPRKKECSNCDVMGWIGRRGERDYIFESFDSRK